MVRLDLPSDKLLKLLDDLRKNPNHSIYSSYTILRHAGLTGVETEWINWSANSPSQKLTNFLKKNPAVMDDFGYYYYLYLTTTIDPLLRFMFRDLTPFFEQLAKLYKTAQKFWKNKEKGLEEYQQTMSEYDTVIDCLRLAIQQRYSGIHVGNLLGAKNFNIEAVGGSKKLLMGHESIPLSLLEDFGGTWSGFSIFGYVHKFYQTSCGIINMPNETKMHPEKWWGTYHEVGHVAYDLLKELDEKLYSEYDKLAGDYDEHLVLLINESFADMFDFHYGFCLDWNFYIETVWRYLAENFPISGFYLARLLLLYFSIGPGKNCDLKKKPIEGSKKIEEVTNRLELIGKSVYSEYSISGKTMQNAADYLYGVLNATRLLSKYLRNTISKGAHSKEIINEKLKQGICLNVDSPNIIINSMLCSEDLSLRKRITAILSLYNYAAEKYHSS